MLRRRLDLQNKETSPQRTRLFDDAPLPLLHHHRRRRMAAQQGRPRNIDILHVYHTSLDGVRTLLLPPYSSSTPEQTTVVVVVVVVAGTTAVLYTHSTRTLPPPPKRKRRERAQQQPPSKGSLRGSKCTPLCNSQLPACKPIVCRRSQVSKSYIDAEQRRQRSSISILAVRRRARALSSRSDQ